MTTSTVRNIAAIEAASMIGPIVLRYLDPPEQQATQSGNGSAG